MAIKIFLSLYPCDIGSTWFHSLVEYSKRNWKLYCFINGIFKTDIAIVNHSFLDKSNLCVGYMASISFVELMAELGISDVSEVSDPPLSEDDSPLAKFKQAVSKKAANKQDQSDEESDWDSSRVRPN